MFDSWMFKWLCFPPGRAVQQAWMYPCTAHEKSCNVYSAFDMVYYQCRHVAWSQGLIFSNLNNHGLAGKIRANYTHTKGKKWVHADGYVHTQPNKIISRLRGYPTRWNKNGVSFPTFNYFQLSLGWEKSPKLSENNINGYCLHRFATISLAPDSGGH